MEQITKYLDSNPNNTSVLILENIAKLDDITVPLKDKIVLSLLNMEEESTLRNVPNTTIKDGKTIYKNNKVNLNLYVLFSANRTSYSDALIAINHIVEFFQSKKVFNQMNTPFTASSSILDEVSEFKFVVELYTPTFEQLNYIWGMLGGKSVPSVLYKISIVEIESAKMRGTGTPITNIVGELNDSTI